MKVGFTGTQKGMTDKQKAKVRAKLIELDATEFHHGNCVGSDDESDTIARDLGITPEIHPPEDERKSAHCERKGKSRVREPLPYLIRNHNIVDAVDFLIGTPKEKIEQLRSGTWATIRYARKIKKPGVIFFP